MDSDMALAAPWVQMFPWGQLAIKVTQISMTPVAAWPSDIHITSCDCTDHRYLLGLSW